MARHGRLARERFDPGWLGRPSAESVVGLHVHRGFRGPQGEPQGNQGLVRSGERGGGSHHPESENVGERPPQFSWGLGSVIDAGGDEAAAKEFVAKLYKNVPVLDTGARGSTSTFAQKGIGDVHLTMESEARLEVEEAGGDLEVVYPSLSILHEPHLTIVDKVVDKKGTRAVAEAYLKFLWTPAGQEIIAKHHYRPIDAEVLAKHAADFPPSSCCPSPGWPRIGPTRRRSFLRMAECLTHCRTPTRRRNEGVWPDWSGPPGAWRLP